MFIIIEVCCFECNQYRNMYLLHDENNPIDFIKSLYEYKEKDYYIYFYNTFFKKVRGIDINEKK